MYPKIKFCVHAYIQIRKQNTHTHTIIHTRIQGESSSSRRGGGGVIGPYLCLEPQQSPRLLSAPPLSPSESAEEEEASGEATHTHTHLPTPISPHSSCTHTQTHLLTHTHRQLVKRAEMKCLSPESPREAELLCCCGTS